MLEPFVHETAHGDIVCKQGNGEISELRLTVAVLGALFPVRLQ